MSIEKRLLRLSVVIANDLDAASRRAMREREKALIEEYRTQRLTEREERVRERALALEEKKQKKQQRKIEKAALEILKTSEEKAFDVRRSARKKERQELVNKVLR